MAAKVRFLGFPTRTRTPLVPVHRRQSIGLGKEGTSGTAVAAGIWIPKTSGGFSPIVETAEDQGAYGVIDAMRDVQTVKNMTEIAFEGNVRDNFIGHLMHALFGQSWPTIKFPIPGSITGTYVEGEVITETTSGATGVLRRLDAGGSSKALYVSVTAGTFTGGQTLTGATSGATATGGTIESPSAVRHHVFRRLNSNTHSGTSTLNVNTLGAKTIKKLDGATNLSAGDIVNGQIVVVQYDGTNFQMLSPVAVVATQQYYDKTVYAAATDSATIGASSTAQANFATHAITVPLNTLIAGVGYEFECGIATNWISGNITFAVRLGSVDISSCSFTPSANSNVTVIRGFIIGTEAAGAAANVEGLISVSHGGLTNAKTASGVGSGAAVDTTNNQTLQFSGQYSASDIGHGLTMLHCRIRKFSTTVFS